jgi:hypothetical protein
MDELRLGIYVPSCGRAKTTNTYKLIDDCTYVVRKSEEEEYRKAGIHKIWAVDDELIDNYVKVSNYINDNSEEDIIFTIDDDVDAFLYRLDKTVKIEDKDIILSEIERIAQIIVDLNIGFGAEDAAITPWNYVSEFTFKGTTGAMRWYNKKAYKSRYDEKVYHNCDLDVMLHELLVNRIILRPMYFCVDAKTDTNEGGNSSKTRQDQIDCANEMKRRWGRHFDYNFKNNKPKISVER